ncbi:MAG: hypothetical protein ACK4IT_05090 [Thioalkalivibrionaceae bacterium]
MSLKSMGVSLALTNSRRGGCVMIRGAGDRFVADIHTADQCQAEQGVASECEDRNA